MPAGKPYVFVFLLTPPIRTNNQSETGSVLLIFPVTDQISQHEFDGINARVLCPKLKKSLLKNVGENLKSQALTMRAGSANLI